MAVLFLLFSTVITAPALGQKTDTTQLIRSDREPLLSKSKTQKTIGWIILGTGIPVVLSTTYLLVAIDESDIEKGTVRLAFAGSLVYSFVGYRLVKAGKRNKEKALSFGFNPQRIPRPELYCVKYKVQPAIILHISF